MKKLKVIVKERLEEETARKLLEAALKKANFVKCKRRIEDRINK